MIEYRNLTCFNHNILIENKIIIVISIVTALEIKVGNRQCRLDWRSQKALGWQKNYEEFFFKLYIYTLLF